MQIKKFKLINDGYDGIKVSYAEAIKIEKAATIDLIERTRSIPVSLTLKAKIAGLTYFFLNLTRHWVTPFNNYFNLTTYDLKPIDPGNKEMKKSEELLRNLWNDTTITGASINNGDIILTGKINTFGDKTMGLATPTICAEDDFGFYEELKTRLDEIGDDVADIMNQKKISIDAKQMMFSFPDAEDGKEMTADELAETILEKLSDKGVVILDAGPTQIPQDTKTNLKPSKNPVDGKNIPEAKMEKGKDKGKEKEEKQSVSQAKKNADIKEHVESEKQGGASTQPSNTQPGPDADKGTLASESDFPDLDANNTDKLGSTLPQGGAAGDLSQYEHSRNMGSESGPGPDDAGQDKQDNEPWGE